MTGGSSLSCLIKFRLDDGDDDVIVGVTAADQLAASLQLWAERERFKNTFFLFISFQPLSYIILHVSSFFVLIFLNYALFSLYCLIA